MANPIGRSSKVTVPQSLHPTKDDAIDKYGIELYHREFFPLEWSISQGRHDSNAFAKIVVEKTSREKVLGIHYVGPNAGDVMQVRKY
jgi:thioredoxin reductase (NADPH)